MANIVADNSKHRSCWRHLAAFLQGNPGTVKDNEITKILQRFERTSPCFYNEIAHHKRSVRRDRCLPKQRSKMDSFTFDDHLETIWGTLSQAKSSEYALVGSICFSLYRRNPSKGLDVIKKADIFSKKLVFLPILCWDHWRLVIFCHFGEIIQSETKTRCILLLDSAQMGAQNIVPEIRKFVYDIFEAVGRPEIKDVIYKIPLLVPKVPQQKNDVDCGRFVLYFIKQFIDAAPDNFSISNGSNLMEKWFDPGKLEEFCEKLEKESSLTQTRRMEGARRCSQRITKKRGVPRKPSRKKDEVICIDE